MSAPLHARPKVATTCTLVHHHLPEPAHSCGMQLVPLGCGFSRAVFGVLVARQAYLNTSGVYIYQLPTECVR